MNKRNDEIVTKEKYGKKHKWYGNEKKRTREIIKQEKFLEKK